MTSDNHVTGPVTDAIDLLALQSLVDRLNSAGVTVAQTERGGWKLYDNEAALYELKQMAPDLARAILAMKSKEQASVHSPDEVERVALAIERADRERVPDGAADGFDHPEISDWGIHLARAAISALSRTDDRLREALEYIIRQDGKGPDGFINWQHCVNRIQAVARAALQHPAKGEGE